MATHPSARSDPRQQDRVATGWVVTPSDSDDQPLETREIYINVGGNIKVTWADNTTTTHVVKTGERLKWRVKRIWSTGTTATGIEAFA